MTKETFQQNYSQLRSNLRSELKDGFKIDKIKEYLFRNRDKSASLVDLSKQKLINETINRLELSTV